MTKTNVFVALALCATTACDNRTIEQKTGYAYGIETPTDNRCLTCPGQTYADSVRAEGYCITYYRDGYEGRICGPYSVHPIIQPSK